VARAAAASEDWTLADGRRVCVYPESKAIAEAIVEETAREAKAAIAEKGAFSLCVPGGFVPEEGGAVCSGAFVAEALAGLATSGVDFTKVHVFFCGDRFDSTDAYDLHRKAWIDACGIPLDQVHPVPPGSFGEGVAAEYTAGICMQEEEVISDSPSGLPAMDLMLLEVASDGSVGRLRPNSEEMNEVGSEQVVLFGEEGVALSLDFMNGCRRAILVAPSEVTKEPATVAAALAPSSKADCPAGMVRAQSTTWLLETATASGVARS